MNELNTSLLTNNNKNQSSSTSKDNYKNKFASCKFTAFILKSILMSLFYYIDIAKDIHLIIQYYKRDKINYVIATSIILAFPTLFMIFFFTLGEIFATTHSKVKKFLNCLIYVLIFLVQFHIIKRLVYLFFFLNMTK
jgi:hypothetical protein